MVHSTLLVGTERRRKWSDEDRRRIVEEAFAPGAIVADVARRWEISTALIYTWRRAARLSAEPAAGFLPAIVSDDGGAPFAPTAAITIVLQGRATISIATHATPALVRAALGALL